MAEPYKGARIRLTEEELSLITDYRTKNGKPRSFRGARAPVKWNEGLWEEIIGAVRAGVPLVAACGERVSVKVVEQWIAEDEDLAEEIALADQRAHLSHAAHLIQQAKDDGKLMLKVLQTRWPEHWRERSVVDVNQTTEVSASAMAKLDALIAATRQTTEPTDGPK